MARARNIKPGFFDNDRMAELDPLARLLFIGLWTIADYKGDLEWRPKRVKAKLLPYDDCDVEQLAINLDNSGFIRFYSDAGVLYVAVMNFTKHQNPHKNEKIKGSSIPAYDELLRQAVDLKGVNINLDKSGLKRNGSASDPADSLNLIPDPPILIPEEDISPAAPAFNFKQSLLDHGVEQKNVDAWMAVRKKTKAVDSDVAFNALVREAKKAEISVNEAVQVAAEKSWRGFEAGWYDNAKGNSNAASSTNNRHVSEVDKVRQANTRKSNERKKAISGERGVADTGGAVLEPHDGIVRIPLD